MSSKPSKSLKKRLSMKMGKKEKAEKAAPKASADPTPAAAAASAMPGPGTPEEKVKGWFKANPGESPAPPSENKKKLVFNDDAALSVGPDDSVSQVARGEAQGVGKLLAFAGGGRDRRHGLRRAQVPHQAQGPAGAQVQGVLPRAQVRRQDEGARGVPARAREDHGGLQGQEQDGPAGLQAGQARRDGLSRECARACPPFLADFL